MKNIEVYTINNCGFCEAAKSLLANRNLPFSEFNITDDNKGRIDLVERTHHRTMPQIFIEGQFIGGYTELKKHLQDFFSPID
jgi:glutaredoxin 3